MRLLPIAACLSIQAASAQQMLGNLSASVDVKTEGLFVLTNPARTQGINVYVKVAYKGGAFENRLMPNGEYQLVPMKPPTIGARGLAAERLRNNADQVVNRHEDAGRTRRCAGALPG